MPDNSSCAVFWSLRKFMLLCAGGVGLKYLKLNGNFMCRIGGLILCIHMLVMSPAADAKTVDGFPETGR